MIDLILFAIILVLLGGFGWYVREQEKVKTKLINAILAKDSTEYVNRTLADATDVVKPDMTPNFSSDLVPETQLSDEDFDAHIAQQLEEVQ